MIFSLAVATICLCQWTAPYGLWGAPTAIATLYNEYMQRYGATREEMATLVTTLRQNVLTRGTLRGAQ